MRRIPHTMATSNAKQAVHQTIRNVLREEILSGVLPGGSALRPLESEGLVTHHLNRGATVASMNVEQICELLDMRVALECHAAKLAVPNMVERDFEAADRILDAYQASTEIAEWAEYNRRLVEAARQRDVAKMVALLEEHNMDTKRELLATARRCEQQAPGASDLRLPPGDAPNINLWPLAAHES